MALDAVEDAVSKLKEPDEAFLSELRKRCVSGRGSVDEALIVTEVSQRMAAGEDFPTADEIRSRSLLRVAAQ